MKIDNYELAWAAGFFDGEGHAASQLRRRKVQTEGRRTYASIILDIRQIDRQVLDRFRAAVGGLGHIYGPYKNKNPNANFFWAFEAAKFEDVQAIVAMLWRYLSPIKRAQTRTALVTWRTRPRKKVGRKTNIERLAA